MLDCHAFIAFIKFIYALPETFSANKNRAASFEYRSARSFPIHEKTYIIRYGKPAAGKQAPILPRSRQKQPEPS